MWGLIFEKKTKGPGEYGGCTERCGIVWYVHESGPSSLTVNRLLDPAGIPPRPIMACHTANREDLMCRKFFFLYLKSSLSDYFSKSSLFRLLFKIHFSNDVPTEIRMILFLNVPFQKIRDRLRVSVVYVKWKGKTERTFESTYSNMETASSAVRMTDLTNLCKLCGKLKV
jgi:hypothetical protein